MTGLGRKLGAIVAMMPINDFDALFCNLNGKRRQILAIDKRISEFFDVSLIDISDVKARLNLKL